jgi:outer membrane protein assembly factor BamB
MMNDERGMRLGCIGLVSFLVWSVVGPAALGQLTLSPRFNLSENVRVDEIDNNALGQFRRVDELIAAGQTDEALETLGRVVEEHGPKLVEVEPGRYVSVATYAQLRIAALPDAALAVYRRRVDPQAEAAFRRGSSERDAKLLGRVVEAWFCSTWGDDAALTLGELALERGDYNAARRYWLSLFDSPPTAVESTLFEAARNQPPIAANDAEALDKFYYKPEKPLREPTPVDENGDIGKVAPTVEKSWYVAKADAWAAMRDTESAALVRFWKGRGLIGARLAYPNTDLSLADIRARLVLVDLLSGDVDGAAEKLAAFRTLHPSATGKLAGHEGLLAERLAALVTAAREWPKPANGDRWTTFAADERRSGIATERLATPIALGKPVWRAKIGEALAAHVETDREVLQRQPRIGESWNAILPYFPVVADGWLFVGHADGISAFDATSGREAWGAGVGETGDNRSGESKGDAISAGDALIFRDDGFSLPKANQWTRGVPRFTLTAFGERLIARVGPAATSTPTESRTVPATARSKIVVLDVSAEGQGRLAVDPIELADEKLAFDGTPVTDGRWLYAVLRRSDVRPEVLVACYDLAVNPPREHWRTSVAAAETPGSGQLYEITHNLLTLDGDTLYLNTNLGAVAALATHDGGVRWLHVYPRVKLGDLRRLAETGHFYRDLTPCVVHHDAIVVAPFDAPAIFVLDAATGAMRWSTDAAPDAIHVLGVAGETLWASGDRLYAFDVRTGTLRGRWPEEVKPEPRGIGRGVVVGDVVLWPTRHELLVFDANASSGHALVPKQPGVPWTRVGIAGGNLSFAEGKLVVTTESDVAVFVLDARGGERK